MPHVADRPFPAVPSARGSDSLRDELDRATKALSLAEAADLCLKTGDDVALEALGFTARHIADLRSGARGARAGYPPYALKNLRSTIRLLRGELAQATQPKTHA